MVKLSLVTISYNQKDYLAECIDSVLGQNYPNLEYIIVDPGSTDGSREVIASYDRVLKIFEKDSGPADGLNRGFSRASGEIFGYLNSDDILLPDCLNGVAEIFEKNLDVDVVYGHGLLIDGKGHVLRKCISDKFSLLAAAYGAAMIVQPSTFFRRSLFEKAGGFNMANKSNWDGELLIDFDLAGAKLQRVDRFWSGYRVHTDSITGSGRMAVLHAEYRKRMFEKIMGRSWQQRDAAMCRLMRLIKHLINPRATLERVMRGPVFGREAE